MYLFYHLSHGIEIICLRSLACRLFQGFQNGVAGWIPQEADSEMEFHIQGVHSRTPLWKYLEKGEGTRSGPWEKSSLDTNLGVSSDTIKNSGTRTAFQSCLKLGVGWLGLSDKPLSDKSLGGAQLWLSSSDRIVISNSLDAHPPCSLMHGILPPACIYITSCPLSLLLLSITKRYLLN